MTVGWPSEPRILIVDDEEAFCALLARALQRAGYTKLTCEYDPTRVGETFRRLQPDIVLVDLIMPKRNGFEVIEEIRQQVSSDTFLPILVLTGRSDQAFRKRALQSGANDYVEKSDDLDETILRVRNLLHMRFLYVENLRQREELEQRVRERTEELEETQREILERLAMAAEFRDDDTGEHTRRVGQISEMIALAMGFDEAEARRLGSAALLHDLGKIGVPDQILNKPGRLNAHEMEDVKAHTWVGSQILGNSRVTLLQLAEEVARTHHERWDGKGYPLGLKGEEIPISGRIVALADVLDALTHERPYKEPWPLSRAILEIQRGSGTQFDPAVVEAFLSLDWSQLELDEDPLGKAVAPAMKDLGGEANVA